MTPEPRLARRRLLAARRRRRRRRTIIGLVAVLVLVGVVAAAVALARPDTAGDGEARPGGQASDILATASTSLTIAVTAAASATSTSDRTTAAPTEPAAEIEIGWVGDLTPGSMYGNPPEGGQALFEHTRDYTLSPDIMAANLEGTFGEGGPSKCDGRDSSNCYAFQAPPQNAQSLAWAGFDVVNLANNHSYDYFAAGAQATREALDAGGVGCTGLTENAVAFVEAKGVRVAFLGFSPYSYGPDIGDLEAARELVQAADREADVVVVLMHAGAEGADKLHVPEGGETAYGEFRGDSRAFSHAVIEAGADLVLGSGPHVVRGLEAYEGRLVAYSLGNFAGWGNFSTEGNLALSGLLTVRVAADGRVLGGKWLSLRVAPPGVPEVDESGASLDLVRNLSAEDFATPVELEEDGAFMIHQSG